MDSPGSWRGPRGGVFWGLRLPGLCMSEVHKVKLSRRSCMMASRARRRAEARGARGGRTIRKERSDPANHRVWGGLGVCGGGGGGGGGGVGVHGPSKSLILRRTKSHPKWIKSSTGSPEGVQCQRHPNLGRERPVHCPKSRGLPSTP